MSILQIPPRLPCSPLRSKFSCRGLYVSTPKPFNLPTISPSSTNHHDLPSFLSYARRTSLSTSSPVYIGTYYEYICALTLPRLGFTIARIGGRSDFGIDLLGIWALPSIPLPLRVLVQCKATKAKASPEQIRELEGAVVGAPNGWRGSRTVGVLCAKRAATKGVMEAVRRCGIPVVWVMIEDVGEGQGSVRQVLWNKKVAELGGEGVGVGVKYGERGRERVSVLMWEGREWDPSGSNEENALKTVTRDGEEGGNVDGSRT